MKPKRRISLALTVGALPLLAYPIVLLAGVMSLAGERRGDEPALLMVVVYAFLLGALAYPLVYGPCLAATLFTARWPDKTTALGLSLVPLVYLLALGVFFVAWGALGSWYGT